MRIDADEMFDFDDSAYEAFYARTMASAKWNLRRRPQGRGRTNLMIALPMCASCPCRPDDDEDECKYI